MTPAPSHTSCPRCGAGVRPGSDWCTLCFADLRPVPPPRVSPDPLVVPAPISPGLAAALTAPSAHAETGTTLTSPTSVSPSPAAPTGDAQLPCPVCASPVLLSLAVCQACGAGLFDQLKSGTPTLKVPVLGDVMAMGKTARVAAAFGVAAVVVVILFVIVEILGKL